MGLFTPKPIYKHKILEKYRISISELQECDFFGETSQFRIYIYSDEYSQKYLLRQDKYSSDNIVYLGESKNNMCIYQDKLFAINRINCNSRTNHPLYCIDISTGNKIELNVLSDRGCYIAMHWHCQDCVESIDVINNSVVMEVTRYKEKSHYEEELKYKIFISGNGDLFAKEYKYDPPINRQCETIYEDYHQKNDGPKKQTKSPFDELVLLTVGLPAMMEEAREERMSILENQYAYCDTIILTEFFVRASVFEIVPSKDIALKFSDDYITAVIKKTADIIPEAEEYFSDMLYNRAMLYASIMMTSQEPVKEIVRLASHIIHNEVDKNTYVKVNSRNFRYYGGMLENITITTELGALISWVYDCTADTINELSKFFNNI